MFLSKNPAAGHVDRLKDLLARVTPGETVQDRCGRHCPLQLRNDIGFDQDHESVELGRSRHWIPISPAYSPNPAPLSALGGFEARDVLHPGL
jgi:hypothetical protein